MDYTIMIVIKDGTMAGGYGLTSQLKTFPTRELAEQVAADVTKQARHMGGTTSIIRLYL